MRGKVDVEEVRKDREAIIITEIPYQVNKATMIEKMAELVRDKRIEGISDIRDESDRQGMRVVIELKRDAVADVISTSSTASRRCRPRSAPTWWRSTAASRADEPDRHAQGVRLVPRGRDHRRTKYLLRKARDRAHVLVGLAIAVANIDEVIKLIRNAPDPATAREQLMDAALAGDGCRGADPADRRSAPPVRRTAPTICPRNRRAPSSICAAAPDGAWAATKSVMNSTRSARRSSDYLDILGSRARIQHHRQGRVDRRARRIRQRRGGPKSPKAVRTWTTRT
jgi:DNA gyrase/topoisomerase IV subunit A